MQHRLAAGDAARVISVASKILLAQKRRKRQSGCSRAEVAAGAGKFEGTTSRFCVAAGAARAAVSVTIQSKRFGCRVTGGCCAAREQARAAIGLSEWGLAFGVDGVDGRGVAKCCTECCIIARVRLTTDEARGKLAVSNPLLGAARLRSKLAAISASGQLDRGAALVSPRERGYG